MFLHLIANNSNSEKRKAIGVASLCLNWLMQNYSLFIVEFITSFHLCLAPVMQNFCETRYCCLSAFSLQSQHTRQMWASNFIGPGYDLVLLLVCYVCLMTF